MFDTLPLNLKESVKTVYIRTIVWCGVVCMYCIYLSDILQWLCCSLSWPKFFHAKVHLVALYWSVLLELDLRFFKLKPAASEALDHRRVSVCVCV